MEEILKVFILIVLGLFILWVIFHPRESRYTQEYLLLGFLILLFTIIYCVSFLHYKIGGVIDISELEKTKENLKDVNDFVIIEIGQLGDRSRWQNAYGGDRSSYEALLSLKEKIKDIERNKIVSTEIKTIESVYSPDIMTITMDNFPTICQLSDPPCTKGFEPSIGYNAVNVFKHLDRPLWTERARAAALLRNIEKSPNKESVDRKALYEKLVKLMKKEESSLFVSKMAFETYKELTGFSTDGVFNFESAILDWEQRKGFQ